ncbi:FAD-binding oxidoreductase [Flavobacteriaceae bacterium GSB9]|nr:FAD-binding oxidoreductase [Flavobacteriaceae bacterium GSB9]
MNLSYWEIKSWLTNIDFCIVGSGIVGLNCALYLKQRFPKSKILVLEKGMLPQGASTKNAGFACFGSLSEILSDLETHTLTEMFDLVKKRVDGLNLLRQNLGDTAIGYKNYGGYELFTPNNDTLFNECLSNLEDINQMLFPIFEAEVFALKKQHFNFQNIKEETIYNPFEGQIDTGKMMAALLKKVYSAGVKILNNVQVESFSENNNTVKVITNRFEFSTSKLLIATNGFASQLLNENVKPGRAQVVITKPIKNLQIKGTFHLDRGFYYFRNIDNRILFGGGRNLDFKTEETTEFALNSLIQNKLEDILSSIILPNKDFEIEHRWSGIMGVGHQKKAIVKQVSNNVFCGVRLGGMGIAIGGLIGKQLVDLV